MNKPEQTGGTIGGGVTTNGNGTTGTNGGCPVGLGALPNCVSFATPVVARQGKQPNLYHRSQALAYGTLYPDLNLPFYLKINPGVPADTPLNQLRALEFVVLEMGLYLDTHPYDAETFALFQRYVELEQAARDAYVADHGPLTLTDTARDGTFTWGDGPWPWQYTEEEA